MAKTASSTLLRSTPLPATRGGRRLLLLIGFAFAVMADPVSSVAYTIEASLRALHGHLGLLLLTQIVVFALAITISVAAAVSAVIAYVPGLAPTRIVLGLALLVAVAGLTWFG